MEPAIKKKQVLSNKAIWYKSLDPAKKEKLLSHRAEWYKSLDPEEKEKLLSKSADWYKSLGSAEKQNLLSNRAIQYKSLDTAQKQKRAEWFNLLNSAQKQKRVEWYKSLNPEKKENFCLKEQNGIKHWILQTKIRLHHKSKLIRKPIETQFHMIQIIGSQLFKVRLGKVHIIFALFVTEYYTEKLLNKQMYNTQQELFTELYTHDSFPSWNDLSLIA